MRYTKDGSNKSLRNFGTSDRYTVLKTSPPPPKKDLPVMEKWLYKADKGLQYISITIIIIIIIIIITYCNSVVTQWQ